MPHPTLPRRAALAAFAAVLATPAQAHHGWSWTTDEPFELTGEITELYLGNPHAYLDVVVDGAVWRVELAPPAATQRAGFTEGSAAAGDTLRAFGYRALDAGERRMKAVRIEVRGARYDVYPRRTGPFDV